MMTVNCHLFWWMMSKSNLFSEPKNLKKWAINLANACGGMEVTTHSLKLNKHNLAKVDKLIEQFVVDYNYNMQLANEERVKANEGEEE